MAEFGKENKVSGVFGGVQFNNKGQEQAEILEIEKKQNMQERLEEKIYQ